MGEERSALLERESRWALPVGLLTFLGVVLVLAAGFAASSVSGEGEAEILRSVHEHGSAVNVAAALQAVGFALLAVPLFYLFRAVRARSTRVRGQLVGVIVVAPLFLAVSVGLGGPTRNEAASTFVNGEAKSTLSKQEANRKCVAARRDNGAKSFGEEFEPAKGETALAACETRKVADDEASNASTEASTAAIVTGLGIAGSLGFAAALFYTCLWAMRTGMLGRFWGSLGMAVGVALLIGFILLTVVWFLYLGLLILGFVPGGRPPAWAEGKAVPLPTPGQKAADELRGEGAEEPAAMAGTSPELEIGDTQTDGSERRKRKQRD